MTDDSVQLRDVLKRGYQKAVAAELTRQRTRAEEAEQDRDHWRERAEKAERRLIEIRRYIDEDFRFWCSPNGVAGRYARDLVAYIDRLDGRGEDAYSIVRAQLKAIREEAAGLAAKLGEAELALARMENLRDKWLAWPPDDMHHAAGLMLSKYLDGTAYGSDEPRPDPPSLPPETTATEEET
ncbi:hypothetical protein FXF51_05970 [Nonomuraea sp. PA05]|uniref:hypothetical protein n=1 Tax=Nonomuraea sp. PA05 TaxID=2604466 RepID=UPI0011D4BBB9|nr:hypothetical protein [Nonomuraea sp. PA05]TYB69707.1 hypothetical protein FXF51_05970 [Nonomuraea sp. PA05]